MKSSSINLSLLSESFDQVRMEQLTGRFEAQVDTQQVATYTIADGIATVFSLTPVIATQVRIPVPFSFPVTDCGSGVLKRVNFNIDTMSVSTATCPTQDWVATRQFAQARTIPQQLIADYVGLY